MPKYNFLDLSPVDFEELSRDLLQEHLGITLESFKEGRDLGIDLRYSKDNKNTLIVQCKRYTSITDLKKNLKKEVKKVIKLSPARYIIITSVDLTPKQKNDIKDIFKGIKLLLKDMLGKKDINNLLRKYPDIEKSHYKLWLNSTSVLERILHSSVYNQANFEKDVIEREIKIYVNNDSNKEAFQILLENNYVIISGIPGIGKTTLARMLLYNFLLNEWEIISISEDIKEAYDLYQEGKAQVFYYDDFLGTNFLIELKSKNEDKRIINFIERVKKSKDKKLILTTREYILNQAELKFESLHNSLGVGKCTIDLKKYSKLIKGKILYNHIFYSNLDYTYIDEILKDKRYLKIINHSNYNPRLIQYLTDINMLNLIPGSEYYKYFMDNLDNPDRIWEYAFSYHISSVSQYLLIVFLSMGEPAFKEDLYKALSSFCIINLRFYNIVLNEIEFDKSLRECQRTFINIEKVGKDQIIIKFQNPSIKDFLIFYLNNHEELVEHLINSSIFFNQLFGIYSIRKNQQTVFIEETIQNLLFSKMELELYSLTLSTLYHTYDIVTKDFIYLRYKLDIIDRLERLSRFFDLSRSTRVLEYLVNELSKIDIDDEIDGAFRLNAYLSTVETINQEREMNGKIIIESMFLKSKIENIRDYKAVKRLEDIFPDEFEEFMNNNSYEVDSIINNVIENEESNIEYYLKYELEDIIDDMSTMGPKFELLRENAIDLLSFINEEEEKEAKNKIPEIVPPKINEEEAIINIFNSLKD